MKSPSNLRRMVNTHCAPRCSTCSTVPLSVNNQSPSMAVSRLICISATSNFERTVSRSTSAVPSADIPAPLIPAWKSPTDNAPSTLAVPCTLIPLDVSPWSKWMCACAVSGRIPERYRLSAPFINAMRSMSSCPTRCAVFAASCTSSLICSARCCNVAMLTPPYLPCFFLLLPLSYFPIVARKRLR